jgi:hypothetical protein
MIRAGLSFAALVLALAGPAWAQSRPSIVCTFTQGVITGLDAAPETEETNDPPLLLLFQDVDFNAGTAKLIGNQAPEGVPVMALDGANGFSFIEITPSGNINTTSAFPVARNAPAPAVHSRHVAFGRELTPVISQLFGTCRPSG